MELTSLPSEFWESGALLSDSLNGPASPCRVAWGLFHVSSGQNTTGPLIHAPDFFGEIEEGQFGARGSTVISVSDLESLLIAEAESEHESRGDGLDAQWRPADSDRFHAQCADLFRRMDSGEIHKAVPVTAEVQQAGAPSRAARARALLSAIRSKTAGYLYAFWMGEEGMLGLTPELLLRLDGNLLRTLALAGTAPAEEGAGLLADEKQRAEHNWVVKDLIERLERFGSIRTGETRVVTHGRLSHLRTDLEAQIVAARPFSEWLEMLHPTAALGAYPRAAGQRWLRLHGYELAPGVERGRFGAPMGWSEGHEGLCVVAIRGLFWKGGVRSLPSGCGVVRQSDPAQEWEELALKRNSVRRVLSL